jgi:hypothetical protein
MADLPSERIKPAPPFAYTGIDAFGPKASMPVYANVLY